MSMILISKQKITDDAILTLAHHDFKKGLSARAFFKTRNNSISDELVQETFMKTWKYIVGGGKIEIMKAFLYNILNNLIIDHYRKYKVLSLDYLMSKGFTPSVNDIEKLIDVIDGKKAIFLISRLPTMYRKIMRMRYVQNLTLKEMSVITGKSRNAVAVKAHRGLEKLKLLYKSACLQIDITAIRE